LFGLDSEANTVSVTKVDKINFPKEDNEKEFKDVVEEKEAKHSTTASVIKRKRSTARGNKEEGVGVFWSLVLWLVLVVLVVLDLLLS
jgi:hypothetical protein